MRCADPGGVDLDEKIEAAQKALEDHLVKVIADPSAPADGATAFELVCERVD